MSYTACLEWLIEGNTEHFKSRSRDLKLLGKEFLKGYGCCRLQKFNLMVHSKRRLYYWLFLLHLDSDMYKKNFVCWILLQRFVYNSKDFGIHEMLLSFSNSFSKLVLWPCKFFSYLCFFRMVNIVPDSISSLLIFFHKKQLTYFFCLFPPFYFLRAP